MKAYLTHSTRFDYDQKLYQPLKAAGLVEAYEVVLPHEEKGVVKNSKSLIDACDLILAEVSYASTGQGIELGWANGMGKPIVCFWKGESPASDSLKFVWTEGFEYQNKQELVEKLKLIMQKYER